MKFSNIAGLKRDRQIEGADGVDLKIAPDIYLVVLAASDANPRWRESAQKALAEIRRLQRAGERPEKLRDRLARLYAQTLVIGWHGGYDDQGERIAGGPRDDAGDPVPFSQEACTAFLIEADDAIAMIDDTVFETRNFRREHAEKVIETAKNG